MHDNIIKQLSMADSTATPKGYIRYKCQSDSIYTEIDIPIFETDSVEMRIQIAQTLIASANEAV